MYLNQLQFLRFIGFFFICSLHSSAWTDHWFNISNLGTCSVSFFFILSGFISGYKGGGMNTPAITFNVKDWIKEIFSRIKKLYPLYFITMIITLYYRGGLSQALIYSDYGQLHYITKRLIKNVFMIQTWFPEDFFGIYEISWFISTIMFLYIIKKPILYLIKKYLKNNLHVFILFISTLAITFLYCYITKDKDLEYWQYVFPPSRAGEYILGICLGLLYYPISNFISNHNSLKEKTILFTALEVIIIVAWFSTANALPTFVWQYRIAYWLIPNIILISVFMLGKGYLSKLFSLNPFVTLGNISLECYQTHLLVIQGYVIWNGANAVSFYGNIINFSLCLGITTMIGLYINQKRKA